MEVLNQVEEFHKAFGHPVQDTPSVPANRVALRLNLILEELYELAEASGAVGTFNQLMADKLGVNYSILVENGVDLINRGESNIVECADAIGDIFYVVAGAAHEYGLGKVMPAVSADIHASNMSKLCTTLGQVDRTIEKYTSEGIATYAKPVGESLFAIYRAEDNKILKSIDYTPANLEVIVLGGE
jgi:predicted HAD superfamily Cof-like phosphohydrolase